MKRIKLVILAALSLAPIALSTMALADDNREEISLSEFDRGGYERHDRDGERYGDHDRGRGRDRDRDGFYPPRRGWPRPYPRRMIFECFARDVYGRVFEGEDDDQWGAQRRAHMSCEYVSRSACYDAGCRVRY